MKLASGTPPWVARLGVIGVGRPRRAKAVGRQQSAAEADQQRRGRCRSQLGDAVVDLDVLEEVPEAILDIALDALDEAPDVHPPAP